MAAEAAEIEIDPLAPRRNPDLVGHGAIEAMLASFHASGRMPQALILAGPRGIGKATLAYRFARWLFAGGGARAEAPPSLFGGGMFAPPKLEDESAPSLYIDPALAVSRRVAAAGHADLMTVERVWDPKKKRLRGEILADDARSIAGFMHLTPAEGGWRIVIVDGAEEMTRAAANGILKILEEPPRRSLLLLVSHAPGRLLPTIRSRCRMLRLQPLAAEEVDDLLKQHRPELGAEERAALAALSLGSIGRALELADAEGLALHREMAELLARLPEIDGAALHRLADKVSRNDAETEFDTLRDLLIEWLERSIAASAGGGAPEAETLGEPQLGQAAGRLDRWVDVWEKLCLLFARAESVNLDRKQVILDAFFLIAGALRGA